MQEKARTAFAVPVAAIMLFQVAALFARSLLQTRLIERGWPRQLAQDLSYLVVPPLLFVLMYPYLRRSQAALKILLRPADLTLRVAAGAVAVGLLLRLAWQAARATLAGPGGGSGGSPPAAFELALACPPLLPLLAGIAVMVLLVPLTEEIMHRGFLVHALLPRGRRFAVLASAALFAMLHGRGGYAVAFAGGVILALQVLDRRTLWAPLVSHATYNAAALFDWRCLRLAWQPAPGDALPLLGAAWAVPLAAVCLLLAAFLASGKAAGARQRPRRPGCPPQ